MVPSTDAPQPSKVAAVVDERRCTTTVGSAGIVKTPHFIGAWVWVERGHQTEEQQR
ncbi:MAG: hypothetical protein U0232_30575 [Thermomicrobiales bacterium]